MTDAGYSTSFSVPNTPEQVFAAVNDVRGWWSADIEGDTAQAGDVWFYRARDPTSRRRTKAPG